MPRIHHQRGQRHRDQRRTARQQPHRRILHRARIHKQAHGKRQKNAKAACFHQYTEAKAEHQIPRHHGKRI